MLRGVRRFGGLLLVLVFGLTTSNAAVAADSIDSFDVSATVQRDGVVVIRETITYDFGGNPQKSTSVRDLKATDSTIDTDRAPDITVLGVTIDGVDSDFSTSQVDDPYPAWNAGSALVRIHLRSPETVTSGKHVYVISYAVAGALRLATDRDLADNAVSAAETGDVLFDWALILETPDVADAATSARVAGPAFPAAVQCTDKYGMQPCRFELVDGNVRIRRGDLASDRNVPAYIVYPPSAFNATTIADLRSRIPRGPLEVPFIRAEVPPVVPPFLALGLFVLLLVLPSTLVRAMHQRDRGAVVEAIEMQYEPPYQLRSVELAAAWSGVDGMEKRALAAALLDLAARGYITIEAGRSTELTFDPTVIVKHVLPESRTGLKAWEASLLHQLFPVRPTALLGIFDRWLTSVWFGEFSDLVDEAVVSGRRNKDKGAIRKRWNRIFLLQVPAVGLGVVVVTAVFGSYVGFLPGIAIMLGSVMGGLIARSFSPSRETAVSANFRMLTLGFRRLFASGAFAARRALVQRENQPDSAILATMLSYAVVYDLQDEWMSAFTDLSAEDLLATGFHMPSIASLDGLVSAVMSASAQSLSDPVYDLASPMEPTSTLPGFSAPGNYDGRGGSTRGFERW